MDDRLPRKLAAILYADVAEYSRLTGDDEDSTHKALSEYLDLITLTIKSHRGKVMHYAGDAVLAMFEAVVDAVSCALDIQKDLRIKNADLDDKRKVQFRIGINSGDVIEDRGDIYGDGVNVAARLESLADPGGVCLSDAVRIAIGKKLGLVYEDMGEQKVKNIAEPVRAYKIEVKGEDMKVDPLSSAFPELPGKPSIAVLPFTNMSGDPEQEYFSDGIAEDIITELSKISALIVIARNSTFTYKGKAVDIRTVGSDLRVRYVLEGSVRKSGGRVRITAQLIEASNGHHLWAERYDRELEDIFSLQDEIMREIVSALDIEILAGEQSRFWSNGTRNLQAWEHFRRARDLFNHYRSENHPEVIRLSKKALEFDPEYSAAWQLLANCYFHIEDDTSYPDAERKQADKLSREYLEKSIKCDPSNPDARSLQAMRYLSAREFDDAVTNTNEAVAMAPNHANIIASSAMVLTKCGQPELGLQQIRKAIRLCPVSPMWYLVSLGLVYRLLGNIDESIDTYSEMINRDSDHIEGHIGLVGIMSESGNIERARTSAAEVLRINSEFSINRYFSNIAFRDQAIIERFAEGLRKAGLPE